MSNYHITPEDAVALFEHARMHDIAAAWDIRDAYARTQSRSIDAQSFAYGACFYAGIIEGVRRERAKRQEGNP